MGFPDVFSFLRKKGKPQDHKVYTELSRNIIQASEGETADVLKQVRSKPEGLTNAEARARLREYGENRPVVHKRKSYLQRLFDAYWNPLSLLLTLLAVISYATSFGETDPTAAASDIISAGIILFLLVVSIVLRFLPELQADNAADRLRALVRTTTTVIRDGKKKEIPLAAVVPGDIISLAAGDLVPADLRIIESKDLFVNQAALTGESIAAEKHARIPKDVKSPFELQNMCFMGTNVESGTATAVALFTGGNTYFGAIAKRVVSEQGMTEFDNGIKGFTHLMINFMFVMVLFVFIINAVFKHSIIEAFLFAIAVSVGLTPEMLPMIVTVNLSNGALTMSKKKVIVKKLSSIQNFGAINMLCTDKTGTLTQGKVILEKHIDIHGHDARDVLVYAYMNSFYQTGLRNLMDMSVIDYGEKQKVAPLAKGYKKVDEIPWDFKRRRMSVVVDENGKRRVMICKGAVEEVLKITKRTECDGKVFTPDKKDNEGIRELVEDLNNDGFRVIAIAYKETSKEQSVYSVHDESGMTLLGFVAFLDPPKESARKAIIIMKEQGIEVKVLTGDNELVTNKIARDINLPVKGTLLGSDIEGMSDDALAKAVESNTIFAKVSPIHKERIIRALQKNKHVVGFLGDGINDAPALKAADVGISVDSAVDIAKESSDIILLEKSLLVLEDGITEGRRVFANIIKYARMAASSNFGNMFSVLGASILFPFLPMAPIQILVNNMLYDMSQTAIPTDNVDKEWLAKPRKWNFKEITNFIVFIGPVSSIFDYTTYFFMIFVVGVWAFGQPVPSDYNQALFHTAWFVESLITQSLIIHVIRTKKIPFIESRASNQLLFASLAVCVIGIWLTVSPFASFFGFAALPMVFWPYLAVALVCYVALTQVVKTWYMRRFETEPAAAKVRG